MTRRRPTMSQILCGDCVHQSAMTFLAQNLCHETSLQPFLCPNTSHSPRFQSHSFHEKYLVFSANVSSQSFFSLTIVLLIHVSFRRGNKKYFPPRWAAKLAAKVEWLRMGWEISFPFPVLWSLGFQCSLLRCIMVSFEFLRLSSSP